MPDKFAHFSGQDKTRLRAEKHNETFTGLFEKHFRNRQLDSPFRSRWPVRNNRWIIKLPRDSLEPHRSKNDPRICVVRRVP